jgi:hypothetical protein
MMTPMELAAVQLGRKFAPPPTTGYVRLRRFAVEGFRNLVFD